MQQMNYWWEKWQAQFKKKKTCQFSIVFSLFSFPLNKQGSNASHQTSQNSATLLLFFTLLLISANKQGYSPTSHTA
jgi:hypothetical protein